MNSSSYPNGIQPIDRSQSVKLLYGPHHDSSKNKKFSAGEDYHAEVLSQSKDNNTNVRIGNTAFQIQLGGNLTVGQTLTLRYLNSNPDPSFLLISNKLPPINQIDETTLTTAAQSIGQFMFDYETTVLKLSHYQKPQTLTNNQEIPRLTAENLKQAIDTSGLFYESHLADFLEGKRALSLIMKEPQNKLDFDPTMLVVKQLEILEKNKLHWVGDAWPQQNMDWTTLIEKRPESNNRKGATNIQQKDQTAITSILKFNFEKLGTLKATLKINQGHLQVKFEVDGTNTSRLLKSQTNILALALQNLDQKLDPIFVSSI